VPRIEGGVKNRTGSNDEAEPVGWLSSKKGQARKDSRRRPAQKKEDFSNAQKQGITFTKRKGDNKNLFGTGSTPPP